MAQQTITCPHCRAKKSMNSCHSAHISNESAHFLFVCENCDMPVVLWVVAEKPKYEFRRTSDLDYSGQSFEKCGWRVVDSWPKPQFRKGIAPHGVPDPIGALLEQCHEAAAKGGYDLAIMGYQRVLKMARSVVSPEFRGDLRAWVLSLIESGQLTSDMKSWTNRLKLRGDIEGATVQQVEEFATFVHVVLEQIFGIRSRMAAFRRRVTG